MQLATVPRDGLSTPPGFSLPIRVLEMQGQERRYLYFLLKRAIDMVLCILLLLLFFPLMLLIAILIKLDSPGPVFFVQERVGTSRRTKNGRTIWVIRTFRFYKFRSMVQDADQSLHQAWVRDLCGKHVKTVEHGVKFKLANDSRITRFGKMLRKTSIDELPQLLNVLKGDMSLVGPRPVPLYEAAHYQPFHCFRLAAVPGITGLWQAKARGQVPFDEMIRMDVEYAQNASLWLDIKILFLTIPAVLSGRGAA